MLIDSIFRNVNVTLLCIANTLTLLYVLKSEVLFGGGGGGTRPSLSEFSGSATALRSVSFCELIETTMHTFF